MIGLVLAAGVGQRLRPHTAALPKTLVPVHGELTILDIILRNLAAVDLRDVFVVVGHAAGSVRRRSAEFAARYGVRLHLITNDRPRWNNAYSLWLARAAYADGALLVNGDTVHPVEVEKTLLAQRGPDLLLAVDAMRVPSGEAMKVRLGPAGQVCRISKELDRTTVFGEYIGACVIEPGVCGALTAALEQTWRVDRQRYYEDAFQVLVDGGTEVRAAPLGALDWVEVDDAPDLALAREIACRC